MFEAALTASEAMQSAGGLRLHTGPARVGELKMSSVTVRACSRSENSGLRYGVTAGCAACRPFGVSPAY